MSVTITRADLEAADPCTVEYFLDSPEWDAKAGALVYADFEATAERRASKKHPTALRFLRDRGLLTGEAATIATEALRRHHGKRYG
jgi:hypothetical protein